VSDDDWAVEAEEDDMSAASRVVGVMACQRDDPSDVGAPAAGVNLKYRLS